MGNNCCTKRDKTGSDETISCNTESYDIQNFLQIKNSTGSSKQIIKYPNGKIMLKYFI